MRRGTKWLIGIGIVVVLFLIVYTSIMNTYNELVSLDEEVKAAWAQVENVYQRRYDLIPNLVETVKGYAAHERETLQAVVQARASATRPELNVGDIINDPQKMAQFERAQQQLSSALARLLVVVERYPDLKASENFQTLMAQLEGTENRIAVERRRYNEVVRRYNTKVRQFPTNFFARMFGFEPRPTFEAAPGAEKAPKVDFTGTQGANKQ